MIRRYLPAILAVILYIPALYAQESQSLGDIARKVKAQKDGTQDTTSSAANPAVAPTASNASVSVSQPMPAGRLKVESPAGIAPDLILNFATDVNALEKYQGAIRELLLQEKFESLDKLANEARVARARFPGGFWKIHTIYVALEDPENGDNASEFEWTQQLARLDRWKTQRPDSITARVALAGAYADYGWRARGSGYNDTVTEEGWRLLAERVKTARKILEEAQTLPAKCPEWFFAMHVVGVSEGWDREQMDALFEKAIAFEPEYYYYYRAQARDSLPKWGGEEGDAARFAEKMADRIVGEKGDLMYYEIGTFLNCACDNSRGLNGMSWPRLRRGYAVLEQLYGTAPEHLNKMAYMALTAGDVDFAKKMFDQIGENWDKKTWRTRDNFVDAKRRASQPSGAL
jgi:Domain of unknown function (DUF4034)